MLYVNDNLNNTAMGNRIIESPVAEAPQPINKILSEEMHYSLPQ